MIKFLLKNKLQFLSAVFINVVTFMFLIYLIADRLLNVSGLRSMVFGLLVLSWFVFNVKKIDKLGRLRFTVIYFVLVALMVYVINIVVESSLELSGLGIFVGVMLWMTVWNVADTAHNIREKSKLSLQDLETK